MTYLLVATVSFVMGAMLALVWTFGRVALAKQQLATRVMEGTADREAEGLRLRMAFDAIKRENDSMKQAALATIGLREQVVERESQLRRVSAAHDLFRGENAELKRLLRTNTVLLRQVRIDRDAQGAQIRQHSERADELAAEYLKLTEQWVSRTLTANNYAASKKKIVDAIEWCRSIGFVVSAERESKLLQDLKDDFEAEVRKQIEKEEQSRIRAQIREEQAREREVQKEMDRIERERSVVAAALERALATATDQHSAEVEELRARLAVAEAQQRSVSQAQLTKAGHIYVISNVGSFGDGVYKIGMTRRLEPIDRVVELGDASVPFPFDVHMMISCDNAPKLESEIHKHFHKRRLNRANPRKEYFRVDFEELRQFVERHHGVVQYTASAEALEYRQSLTMPEEDQAYIESVYDRAERQAGVAGDEE